MNIDTVSNSRQTAYHAMPNSCKSIFLIVSKYANQAFTSLLSHTRRASTVAPPRINGGKSRNEVEVPMQHDGLSLHEHISISLSVLQITNFFSCVLSTRNITWESLIPSGNISRSIDARVESEWPGCANQPISGFITRGSHFDYFQ